MSYAKAISDPTWLELAFAGLRLLLDASGALFLPNHATLVVADLHLEKGSRAAAKGRPIPALDSFDTLSRLATVIETFQPARMICLGDSFHDIGAGERMAALDVAALKDVCAKIENWIWVTGNHDPHLPQMCAGELCDGLKIGEVELRHQPAPSANTPCPQIVGHFHPKTSVSTGRYRIHGRCFSVSDQLLILPAFGAYTGGLSCHHAAIVEAHGGKPSRQYLLQRGKIWPLTHPAI